MRLETVVDEIVVGIPVFITYGDSFPIGRRFGDDTIGILIIDYKQVAVSFGSING